MDHLKLTTEKLSVEYITNLVCHESCGAISIFVGTTRDNFENKKVVSLEYEAYESMALKAMKTICVEARQEWPELHNIAIYHRLGEVPCREPSVVVAVSSAHRAAALAAVGHCIDRLKATVPIWKKEVYAGDDAPAWKENTECESPASSTSEPEVDRSLVQVTVSSEELRHRIQKYIERKRRQVDVANVHDFIPGLTGAAEGSGEEGAPDDTCVCARVRAQFVRRTDSKGHLKVHKVYNEWGPQTLPADVRADPVRGVLPPAVAERLLAAETYVGGPVPRDVYDRLKALEDKIAYLQSVSPEYAQFWNKGGARHSDEDSRWTPTEHQFTAEDITRKIELLERQGSE